ncbi:MAG: hypothetical protein AAGA97_02425 [Pseudomonadota bacterium]
MKHLKLKVAPGQADVYVHQTRWPKQKQNPNWRIEVTNIDGRHDPHTQARIRQACEEVARFYLTRWLNDQAPLMTLETVSWPELVKFATQRSFRVLSPYQQRHMRGLGCYKLPVTSDISVDIDRFDADEDEGTES